MKKYIINVILIIVAINNCNSERTQCLKDKKVHTPYYNGDPSCDMAFFVSAIKPKAGQEESTNQLRDLAILDCLIDQIEKNKCEKKSELIPAIRY